MTDHKTDIVVKTSSEKPVRYILTGIQITKIWHLDTFLTAFCGYTTQQQQCRIMCLVDSYIVHHPGSGIQLSKKYFLPRSLVKIPYCGELPWSRGSVLGLRQQGLKFCFWMAVSSHPSQHRQEVFLAQFSLYVHKCGLKPHSFHLYVVVIAASLDVVDREIGESLWPRGSVLDLRPSGLESRILCLKASVIHLIILGRLPWPSLTLIWPETPYKITFIFLGSIKA